MRLLRSHRSNRYHILNLIISPSSLLSLRSRVDESSLLITSMIPTTTTGVIRISTRLIDNIIPSSDFAYSVGRVCVSRICRCVRVCDDERIDGRSFDEGLRVRRGMGGGRGVTVGRERGRGERGDTKKIKLVSVSSSVVVFGVSNEKVPVVTRDWDIRDEDMIDMDTTD